MLVIPLFTDAIPSVHFSNSGFVLAKEMLQAFLGSGRYFHEDGFKNYSWWSLFTATNYEANKQCMEFLLREKSIYSPTEDEMTDLLWSGAALHVAHKNRCISSTLHVPPTSKAITEREWVNQVAQQGTNFRKAFRCPGPASCPFWRLEENDCWQDRDSTRSRRGWVKTANQSLIDA
ncbi:uncharacterized protein LOC119388885 [Rhipicephalus sanguineus]|uniref:uncharacterized protein LOC119388885 n=1 Tax=Rhipicephalus sanguineus TaxID=34632 RepID=UPI001895DFA2|nr:uncharacterized protein LOC119388885 [Rhipicephalus sanguineus]